MRRIAAAPVLLLLLAGCVPRGPALTSVRKHPELWDRRGNLLRVAVVPPEVAVVELQFVGDVERLEKREADYVISVADAVAAQLRSKGYEVKPARLDESDLGENDSLRLERTRLAEAEAEMSFKLYRKGALPIAEAETTRASIGPLVSPIAERAGVDALALVSMEAAVKSSGQQYADDFKTVLFAIGGTYYNPPEAGAILEVMVVDGTSGEVMWSNRRRMSFDGDIQVAPLVKDVMGPMPESAAQRP